MEDFEREIKITFLNEAHDLLSETEKCFLNLEKNPDDLENLNLIFRLAHNLKGSSGVAGFCDLTNLTHNLESLLLVLRNGHRPLTRPVMDLLLRTNDYLVATIEKLLTDHNFIYLNQALSDELKRAADPDSHADDEIAGQCPAAATLENSCPAFVDFSQMPISAPAARNKEENIRVSLARIENLLNNVGELSILQAVMMQQGQQLGPQMPALMRSTINSMSKIIKETQSVSMGLRMLPIKQMFQKMERIVRDTSKALGKEIQLHLVGEETEIDKTVLEQLSDPLVHIVRNAVDHGIEDAESRQLASKSPVGKIRLSASHRSGQIVIEIRDDGKGLDAEFLIAKAKAKGVLREDANLSDEEAYQLIFAPGFSTKEHVTDVSGRGVGMDVVKTNILALQGQIEIETTKGSGTCLRILLPLTLAIVDSVIIYVAAERYVVPLSQVSEFYRPKEADINYVCERSEIITIRNESLPSFRLAKLIKRPDVPAKATAELTALVIRDISNRGVAILVDKIVAQQQVVIKPLGRELKGRTGFMGCAILGDGKPALILDLFELTKSVSKSDNRKTA
jgi:two-component system chemotaxis sensor kinase CheA